MCRQDLTQSCLASITAGSPPRGVRPGRGDTPQAASAPPGSVRPGLLASKRKVLGSLGSVPAPGSARLADRGSEVKVPRPGLAAVAADWAAVALPAVPEVVVPAWRHR
jgi:hypothetical protein